MIRIARSYGILHLGLIRMMIHIKDTKLTTYFLQTMGVVVNLGGTFRIPTYDEEVPIEQEDE